MGDSSVKLVLHNENKNNVASPCSSASNYVYAAFARTASQNLFNIKSDDNAYVGFMYGTPKSSDYASTHANINKSLMMKYLENWYTENLAAYSEKVEDTTWCNDKSIVTDTKFNPWNMFAVFGVGYNIASTYYGATQRLVSTSGDAGGTGPSLKCNGELSKITTKTGLLTADEIVLAGYTFGIKNETTYLFENAGYGSWWTMTPCSMDLMTYLSPPYAAQVCVVDQNNLSRFTVDDQEAWFRPAISLVSSTTISGGSGTSEDPYIVD